MICLAPYVFVKDTKSLFHVAHLCTHIFFLKHIRLFLFLSVTSVSFCAERSFINFPLFSAKYYRIWDGHGMVLATVDIETLVEEVLQGVVFYLYVKHHSKSIAAFIAFKLLNWLCWIRKGTRGGVEKTQGQSQVEVSTSVVSSNFSWWVPTKEDSSSSNYCMIKLLLSFLARSISTIEMDVLSFWFFSTD